MNDNAVLTMICLIVWIASMWLMYIEYKRATDSVQVSTEENVRLLQHNTTLLRNNLAFSSVNRNLSVMLNQNMELLIRLKLEFETIETVLDVRSEDVDIDMLRAQCLHIAGVISATERRTNDAVEKLNGELRNLLTEHAS